MVVFLYTNHKKLWNFLADNPQLNKLEAVNGLWPSGEFDEIEDSCFACEYARQMWRIKTRDKICDLCPLQWPFIGRCMTMDEEDFGLFRRWLWEDDLQKRAIYARIIANLPVKKGIKYI